MTDIQAPDGTIARFPDGMSDDAITAIMRQHYPPPVPADASFGAKGQPLNQQIVPPGQTVGGSLVPAVASTLRAINEGIPFSDRIVAGAKSLPIVGNDQSYAANLAQEQAAREQLNRENPFSTAFARGVGGLLTAAALPGASVAEAGLAPAMVAGARTGAAYGAAQGVSEQPNLNNAGASAYGGAKGAVQGAGLGTLLSGLGYGVGNRLSALADRLSPVEKIEGNRSATNALLQAAQRDLSASPLETPPPLGAKGMTLDTGPAMLQLAQAVGAKGAGAPIVTNALTSRMRGIDTNITNSLPGIIGPDQSANAAALGIRASKAEEGSALPGIFEGSGPVDISPVISTIDRLFSTTASGTPEAQALAKARGMLTELAPAADENGPAAQWRPINPTDGEHIVSAAIKTPSGETFTGPNHALALDRAGEAGHDTFNLVLGAPLDNGTRGPTAIDGFITSTGRFINRAEAANLTGLRGRAENFIESTPDPMMGFSPGAFDKTSESATQPITDAAKLQSAKMALDNLIKFGDPTIGVTPGALAAKTGALKTVAGGINDSLRAQTPGYAGTMDALASLNRQMEALQYGRGLLGGGSKSAINPADFAAHIAALPADEATALRAGLNSSIYQDIGVKGNARLALNKILPTNDPGSAKWNSAKLAQVLSPKEIQGLQDLQGRSDQFARSYNSVVANSQTAQRSAAIQELNGPNPIEIARRTATPYGRARFVAGETAKALFNRFGGQDARDTALARALTAQGPAKDAISDAFLRLMIDRATRPAINQAAGMAAAPFATGLGLGMSQ